MSKYKYDIEREVKISSYLYKAAKQALELTENFEKGCLYQFMASLVFSAFAFEAGLNEIGERAIPFWNELESIKPIQKFKVLGGYLKLPIDMSRRPGQTITLLFKFRNTMAHGKMENLSGAVATRKPDIHPSEIPSLKTFWEEFCTKEHAKEALEDIKKILESLRSAAGLPTKYFLETLGAESFQSI